jgi:hypothetical protein
MISDGVTASTRAPEAIKNWRRLPPAARCDLRVR